MTDDENAKIDRILDGAAAALAMNDGQDVDPFEGFRIAAERLGRTMARIGFSDDEIIEKLKYLGAKFSVLWHEARTRQAGHA